MKKLCILLAGITFYFSFFSFDVFSQGVGVNTTGSPANPAAILDASSTNQGLLVPRMSMAQRNAIASPAESLLIFDTDTRCFEAYNGATSQWVSIACLGGIDACGGATTITDSRDNQVYNIVAIGTQCWMGQNLNYGTYEALPATGAQPAGYKYCASPNNTNDPTCALGGIYEWATIMNGSSGCNGTCISADGLCDGTGDQQRCSTPVQGLCPAGWHLPSHYEWTQLEQTVCAQSPAGSNCRTDFPYDITSQGWEGSTEGTKLKATTSWGTNEGTNSGFTAVPGSYSSVGKFSAGGAFATYYTSSDATIGAWYRRLWNTVPTVFRGYGVILTEGNSVRCVKN